MDRRKFLYGIGGSAIGGSALIGSGAFSRIESQRRVKIEVAGDPDAYLGLDRCPTSPNNSYVDFDDSGHLAVEMSEDNPTEEGGQGLTRTHLPGSTTFSRSVIRASSRFPSGSKLRRVRKLINISTPTTTENMDQSPSTSGTTTRRY
ncbi:hypothetical protein D8S78_06655 [Natrialba swarupiae]|nr:hypothetical protein [Natrialba swarupiae]